MKTSDYVEGSELLIYDKTVPFFAKGNYDKVFEALSKAIIEEQTKGNILQFRRFINDQDRLKITPEDELSYDWLVANGPEILKPLGDYGIRSALAEQIKASIKYPESFKTYEIKELLDQLQGVRQGRINTSQWTVYGWREYYINSYNNGESLHVGFTQADKDIVGKSFPIGLHIVNVD